MKNDKASTDQPVGVITGGGSGIGLATALHFAGMGYRLAICGRDTKKLAEAKKIIEAKAANCKTVALDVANPDAGNRLVAETITNYGRIDVLINNAGYAALSSVEEMSDTMFDALLAVNVKGVFHTTRAVWPVMKKQQGGIIINISSMASVDPFTGLGVYGACKAWVNLFSKACADEGKSHGIRVYSVGLGAVETGMLRGLFPDFPKERTMSAEEVAQFLGTLCDDSMKHTNGQSLFLKK